jgi:hypothetical protein
VRVRFILGCCCLFEQGWTCLDLFGLVGACSQLFGLARACSAEFGLGWARFGVFSFGDPDRLFRLVTSLRFRSVVCSFGLVRACAGLCGLVGACSGLFGLVLLVSKL